MRSPFLKIIISGVLFLTPLAATFAVLNLSQTNAPQPINTGPRLQTKASGGALTVRGAFVVGITSGQVGGVTSLTGPVGIGDWFLNRPPGAVDNISLDVSGISDNSQSGTIGANSFCIGAPGVPVNLDQCISYDTPTSCPAGSKGATGPQGPAGTVQGSQGPAGVCPSLPPFPQYVRSLSPGLGFSISQNSADALGNTTNTISVANAGISGCANNQAIGSVAGYGQAASCVNMPTIVSSDLSQIKDLTSPDGSLIVTPAAAGGVKNLIVDTTKFQKKIGSCPSGAITSVDSNGGVTCAPYYNCSIDTAKRIITCGGVSITVPISFTVVIDPAGTGSGTVSSDTSVRPQITNCANTCSSVVSLNTTVKLTAEQAADSVFIGWTSGCTASNGTSCTVSIPSSASGFTAPIVKARFDKKVSLTVVNTGGGNVVGYTPNGTVVIKCGTLAGVINTLCQASLDPAAQVGMTVVADSSVTGGDVVSLSNSAGGCSKSFCPVVMGNGPQTVTAVFSAKLTVTKKVGGSNSAVAGSITSSDPSFAYCGTACATVDAILNYGNPITLHADPSVSIGYIFSGWSVAGDATACTDATKDCTVAMTKFQNVTANFTQQAGLSITVGVGGSVVATIDGVAKPVCAASASASATCSYPVTTGKQVSLQASVADVDHSFSGWTGGTTLSCTNSTTNPCAFSMPATAVSQTANFTQKIVQLALAKSAGGTVTSNDVSGNPDGKITATNCAPASAVTCNASYPQKAGSQVMLLAVPSAGYLLTGWNCYSSSIAGDGSSGQCFTKLDSSPQNVTATFTAQSFKLTVTKAGATGTDDPGTITSVDSSGNPTSPLIINCGATCSSTVSSGSSVTLKVTASAGYTFSGWSGVTDSTCPANDPTKNCTVAMTAAKTVTANFTKWPNFYVYNIGDGQEIDTRGANVDGSGTVSIPNAFNAASPFVFTDKPTIVSDSQHSCAGQATSYTDPATNKSVATTEYYCTTQAPANSTIKLTATPATGSYVEWAGVTCIGTGETKNSPSCTFNFTPQQSIAARFYKKKYTLTITNTDSTQFGADGDVGLSMVLPTGNVSYSCVGGKVCSYPSIPQGTPVVIQAYSYTNYGYLFYSWVSSTGFSCARAGPCNVDMSSGDQNITVHFASGAVVNLTMTPAGGGMVGASPSNNWHVVSCTSTCFFTGVFYPGTKLSLMAYPKSGGIPSWGDACLSAGSNAECVITVPNSAVTNATLAFTPKTYTLLYGNIHSNSINQGVTGFISGSYGGVRSLSRCSPDAAGIGNSTASMPVVDGSLVTLFAGYTGDCIEGNTRFTGWTGSTVPACDSQPGYYRCTVKVNGSNRTIHANFN